MAMTKAEMEHDCKTYENAMEAARTAHRNGLFRDAVKFALSAWDCIDGMMQYARRYEKAEFESIEAIDLVLKYSPMLFDYETLNALESMLKAHRRIERNTADDMGEKLSKARALMWDAHRMWNHLEANAEARQDELRAILGGDQGRWRSIAEAWERMGVLRRRMERGSYRLALIARLGEIVSAKCPSCGGVADAPKAMWLEHTVCPHCHTAGMFVIRGKSDPADTKE